MCGENIIAICAFPPIGHSPNFVLGNGEAFFGRALIPVENPLGITWHVTRTTCVQVSHPVLGEGIIHGRQIAHGVYQ
jgi:hypothetical protein